MVENDRLRALNLCGRSVVVYILPPLCCALPLARLPLVPAGQGQTDLLLNKEVSTAVLRGSVEVG